MKSEILKYIGLSMIVSSFMFVAVYTIGVWGILPGLGMAIGIPLYRYG